MGRIAVAGSTVVGLSTLGLSMADLVVVGDRSSAVFESGLVF